MSQDADHAKGLALTGLGGLLLSFDIPLIRLSGGDMWSVLALRSVCTVLVAVVAHRALKLAGRNPPPMIPGRAGMMATFFYTVSTLCFMGAVYLTTTANLVFILALNPMIAALMGWAFLGERPKGGTFLAMAAMLAGVALIVSDGLSSGHLAGDLLALVVAASVAAALTVSRANGGEMGFTILLAATLPAMIGVGMTAANGFQLPAPGWILLNGLVVIPAAMYLLATGPRWLTGPETAMFYLLETVLAPVWVWMIFAEAPTRQALAGGAILIAALGAHSLWQMRRNKAARAGAPA